MLAFVLFLRRGPSPVTFSLPPPSLARGGGSLLVSVEANASRLQRERGGRRTQRRAGIYCRRANEFLLPTEAHKRERAANTCARS